jgi:hypothetical protein
MKAGYLVSFLGQQVELEHLALVEEHLAEVPDNALVHHRDPAAEPVATSSVRLAKQIARLPKA